MYVQSDMNYDLLSGESWVNTTEMVLVLATTVPLAILTVVMLCGYWFEHNVLGANQVIIIF